MTKLECIAELRKRLAGLPADDLEERLGFYGEMIDDRIEDGLSEEEAVSDIGSVEEIAAQIIAETPLAKIAKEKIKKKRGMKTWEIVLLAVGSPIWLSLAVAAFAVILSLYAVFWSLVVAVWAVFVAICACVPGGAVIGVAYACHGNVPMGLAMIGVAVTCAGLSIFLFFGSREATRGIVVLTKKIAVEIKKCFVGKEREA